MIPIRSSCHAFALATLYGALPLAAQWVPTPCSPVDSVTTQAFAVYATCAGSVYAFSAMGTGWQNLGVPAPGLPVQYGDWTALLPVTPGQYRAYSARLHQFADISFASPPAVGGVYDDVILMIGTRVGSSVQEACAYSAETNTWVFAPAPTVDTTSGSRFVLGVRVGSQVLAFGSRHATWSSTTWTTGATLVADGNVLLIRTSAPATVKAFSAVLGTWSESPAQYASSSAQLDHNVAYVRAAIGPFGRHCAYSAYNGTWVTGAPVIGTPHLVDNVVLLEQTGTPTPSTFQAFGARPGVWDSLTLPLGASYVLRFGAAADRGDWVIVDDTTTDALHAFSGVAGGDWNSRSYSGSLAVFQGRKSVAVGLDSAASTHAFSAILNAWSPPLPMPGGLAGTLAIEASYAVAYGAGTRTVFSGRSGVWIAGPPFVGPLTTDFGGSIFAMYDASDLEIDYWHERIGAWITTPPAAAGPPVLTASRNVVLVDFTLVGGTIHGLSAQRGDATSLGFVPPVMPLYIGQNVACVRDATGTAHGFGSPNATHSFFQYPHDSEFQTFQTSTLPTPCKTMIRGASGDGALLLVSALPTAMPFPPYGILYCAAPWIPITASSTIGPNGLLSMPVPFTVPPIAPSIELCTQGVTVGSGGVALVGSAPEPVRFH